MLVKPLIIQERLYRFCFCTSSEWWKIFNLENSIKRCYKQVKNYQSVLPIDVYPQPMSFYKIRFELNYDFFKMLTRRNGPILYTFNLNQIWYIFFTTCPIWTISTLILYEIIYKKNVEICVSYQIYLIKTFHFN